MVGEGTTAIFITFLLAVAGYAGLTAVVLLSTRGRVPVQTWRIVAGIILIHVLMVWTFRYRWEFALAVRNGYAGFVLFHLSLAAILVSTVVRERLAVVLIRLAYLVVTAGAIGATILYDVVSIYRIPVILLGMAGTAGLLRALLLRRRARAEPSVA